MQAFGRDRDKRGRIQIPKEFLCRRNGKCLDATKGTPKAAAISWTDPDLLGQCMVNEKPDNTVM